MGSPVWKTAILIGGWFAFAALAGFILWKRKTKPGPTEPVNPRPRREYLAVRSEYNKIMQDESVSHTKVILQLGAGAIGVSLLLLEKILKDSVDMRWLYGSWLALTSSMVFSVLGFYLSKRQLKRHIMNLDREQAHEPQLDDFILKSGHFDLVAGICLILGIMLLVFFSITSIKSPHGNPDAQVQSETAF